MKDRKLTTSQLREALHYVARFRNATFIIALDGRVLESSDILSVAEDISLIHAIGIRTVLVLGSSDQTDYSMRRKNRYARLQSLAKQLVQHINTVHHGLFIPRKQEDEELNRFAVQVNEDTLGSELLPGKVKDLLDKGLIPLVVARPKDGHSEESWFASLLRATNNLCTAILTDKLIYLSGADGILQSEKALLREAGPDEIHRLIADGTISGQVAEFAKTAETVINAGVTRVHFINGKVEGGLLCELFTKDGVGTMIYKDQYQEIRPARTSDISGILDVLGTQGSHGDVRRHTEEAIGAQLANYRVVVKDNGVIACGCLRCFPEEKKALISSLGVDQPYLSQGIGELLLKSLFEEAKSQGVTLLTLISQQTGQWWLGREFDTGKVSDLPNDLHASVGTPSTTILVSRLED